MARKNLTPVTIDAEWANFPSILLENQRALNLDAVDINIILHLTRHWRHEGQPPWERGAHTPYPSKGVIAKCMGVSISTVQRRIAAMEKRGLVMRKYRFNQDKGQVPNEYVFDGLVHAAINAHVEALPLEMRKYTSIERRVKTFLARHCTLHPYPEDTHEKINNER